MLQINVIGIATGGPPPIIRIGEYLGYVGVVLDRGKRTR